MFTNLAKVQMTHVPYKGAGPALTDLLGGQVSMMFATAAAASSQVAGVKLRAVGVTSPRGASALKDVVGRVNRGAFVAAAADNTGFASDARIHEQQQAAIQVAP